MFYTTSSNIATQIGNQLIEYGRRLGTGGGYAEIGMLEYERLALQKMYDVCKIIRIPKPHIVGTLSNGENFITLEYIDSGNYNQNIQSLLGKGLAEMHMSEPHPPTFYFPLDGCCGQCPQRNNIEQRMLNWVEFYREYRLGDQLEMLKKNCNDPSIQEKGIQLMKRLPEFFSMIIVEDIKPSLLHGDLWNGNFNADNEGRPVIFDPACYYGHHEADLGIARMFGGFNNNFWSTYHQIIPKSPGYEKRALLYELHHHLNHSNIFGSSYLGGCHQLIDQLLK